MRTGLGRWNSLLSLSSVSRISQAARTALVSCSSSGAGAPKNAIMPSPMNLSSVPPWRNTSAVSWSNSEFSNIATCAGAMPSDSAVKPQRSANSTVTTFSSAIMLACMVGWMMRSTTCGEL